MGTRNLTCVFLDGVYKVAQYGQWDGYPGGAGLDCLHFLRDRMKRELFEANVRAAKQISETDFKALWTQAGAKPDGDGWVGVDVADRFKNANPHLHRDTGADILEMIQNAKQPLSLKLDIEFAADSLFCEWAWMVDLDSNTFGAYSGFVTEPLNPSERFASLSVNGRESASGDRYYPVKFVKSWPLNALPSDEEFLAAFEEETQDESQDLHGSAR